MNESIKRITEVSENLKSLYLELEGINQMIKSTYEGKMIGDKEVTFTYEVEREDDDKKDNLMSRTKSFMELGMMEHSSFFGDDLKKTVEQCNLKVNRSEMLFLLNEMKNIREMRIKKSIEIIKELQLEIDNYENS